MLRGLFFVLALAAAVHAQGGKKEPEDQRQLQRIRELTRELRDLAASSPSGIPRAADQKRIFAEIAKVNHPQAVRVLVGFAETGEYASAREDLLKILAELPNADEASVGQVMRAHIAPDDPARRIAREYLLQQAQRRRKDEWPISLFNAAGAGAEDKFLALQVMGRIESERTLECALRLAKDRTWSPDSTGLVSCGTIATSVERFEGPSAARLLLLLARDPRFTSADASKVRDATRTWHDTDLRTYVNLAELTDRDPQKRAETALFLGAVPFECARAPLVRVAHDRSEVPAVRAAAATALGGLRIAREDLVAQLRPLLSDADPLIRAGAVAGIGRLNVMQALEALVSMLDGPYGAEARAALSRLSGLPPETDWKLWLRKGK